MHLPPARDQAMAQLAAEYDSPRFVVTAPEQAGMLVRVSEDALITRYLGGNARPCREQILLYGISRHLYCLKNGSIRYQVKVLDPRTSTGKTLLRRFLILDYDTGALYGELHDASGHLIDLASFLARAWSKKPDLALHGVPTFLRVQRSVYEHCEQDLALVARTTGTVLAEVESGFSGGVHAIKQFERAMRAAGVGCPVTGLFDLWAAQRLSALISRQSASSNALGWEDSWASVPEVPSEFLKAVDGLYKEPGGWRADPWNAVLEGLLGRKSA